MKKYLLAVSLIISSFFAYSDEINLHNAAIKKEPTNVAFRKGDTYKN